MAVAVEKHAKVDIKIFFSCPGLLDFSILFKYFAQDCRDEIHLVTDPLDVIMAVVIDFEKCNLTHVRLWPEESDPGYPYWFHYSDDNESNKSLGWGESVEKKVT